MATFEWPLGKLELINSALSQTGDNLVAAADNGSRGWEVCSPAYERGLAYATEAHSWNWVTQWRTLQPSPTAPADTRYDTAYPLPDDLVHVIMVRMNDGPCVWDFLDNQLVVNAKGGPPPPPPGTVTLPVMVKGIFSTKATLENGTPALIIAMQTFVMSGIYRGIKKDTAEAGKLFTSALQLLKMAQARHDMQKPKRKAFVSRMVLSRRSRRPGEPTVRGLGGPDWPEN